MDPRASQSNRRPAYPSVTTTTVTNSTGSISSARSTSSYSSADYTSSNVAPTSPTDTSHYHAAPLPSPTTSHGPFFTSLEQQHQFAQAQLQSQQIAAIHHYQQQQMLAAQQMAHAQQSQQQAQQTQQYGYGYRPERAGSGETAQETNAYIDRYGLVAEAAKRAQMACLERDLSGVELG